MPDARQTRLAVLGSPIAHSKSPLLHREAYRELGLDWTYEATEVTGERLPAFVRALGAEWRGLSLTMPLKRDVLPLLARRDDLVHLTGGANTVLITEGGLVGFNTDVYGLVEALRGSGVVRVSAVQLIGAGATAASVLVAVASLGATEVLIATRSPEKATALLELATSLGMSATASGLSGRRGDFVADLVVSTLPGGTRVDLPLPAEVLSGATLLDVAYDPWPTPLAARFLDAGGSVISGLEMLVNQALAQVRIFVTGSAQTPVDDEARVLQAMRASIGLAPSSR
ncbi:shikimate dehydrogenase [Marisediminicola sp. UYEF4]|uniref:shikimate dehydrogenase n=1 Tax=Marisediminicola sp. UYEF4 TaxID=1756384 RepID=UPI00339350AB